MTTPKPLDQLTALFPKDGPHSHETTVAAAYGLSELVRYLNYATARDSGTPWPGTLAAVIGGTADAVAGLDQALRQTGRRLVQLAAREGATVWDPGEHATVPRFPTAADTANAAADTLGAACAALAQVQAALNVARSLADRLEVPEE